MSGLIVKILREGAVNEPEVWHPFSGRFSQNRAIPGVSPAGVGFDPRLPLFEPSGVHDFTRRSLTLGEFAICHPCDLCDSGFAIAPAEKS